MLVPLVSGLHIHGYAITIEVICTSELEKATTCSCINCILGTLTLKEASSHMKSYCLGTSVSCTVELPAYNQH